jgi:hypothetical protein
MMKVKVEWQDGQVWRSVTVKLSLSRRGNYTFKHDGKVYVYHQNREGADVLVLDSGKWVKAGRVARSCIFLGEGMSSDEYARTPEGIEAAERALQSFLVDRRRAFQEGT